MFNQKVFWNLLRTPNFEFTELSNFDGRYIIFRLISFLFFVSQNFYVSVSNYDLIVQINTNKHQRELND